jgi:hypothetical protein
MDIWYRPFILPNRKNKVNNILFTKTRATQFVNHLVGYIYILHLNTLDLKDTFKIILLF